MGLSIYMSLQLLCIAFSSLHVTMSNRRSSLPSVQSASQHRAGALSRLSGPKVPVTQAASSQHVSLDRVRLYLSFDFVSS